MLSSWRSGRPALLGGAAAVLVTLTATTQPAAAGWAARFDNDAVGGGRADGLSVAGGAVQRLALVGGSKTRGFQYRGFLRAVGGGPAVRVPLDTNALTPPPPTSDGRSYAGGFFVDMYAVRDGRLVVLGYWIHLSDDPNDRTPHSSELTLAAFDGRTGRLVEQRQIARVEPREGSAGSPPFWVAAGNPATLTGNPNLDGADASEDASRLTVPFTDVQLGARSPFEDRFVAGDRVLGFPAGSGERGWQRGAGAAEVADLVTGARRYTVPRSRLLRLARAGVGARPRVALSLDGLAQTGVEAPRSTRLAAVAVDSRGTPAPVGRAMSDVRRVWAMRGHGRAFVYLEGSRRLRDGSRRACRGLWMTNLAGTRGRRLVLGEREIDRQGLPEAWNGRQAVWFGFGPRDRTGVRVDTALHRLTLRGSDLPRCR